MKYNVLMHDVYTGLFFCFCKIAGFSSGITILFVQLLGVGGGKKADQENENAGVSEIRSFCSRGTIYILGQ